MNVQTDIVLTRTIPASPETVFEAWLDPKALASFMHPMEGVTIKSASTDPREGGKYELVMLAGEEEMPHNGEYREIKRHEKLSFSWHSAMAGADSLVTLTFAATKGGHTDLTLRHSGLDSEQARSGHEKGWTNILEVLASAKL